MKTTQIYKGFSFIDDSYTKHIVTYYRSGIVYTLDYNWMGEDENGDPIELDHPVYLEETPHAMGEIEALLRSWDGQNHRCTWQQPEIAIFFLDGYVIRIDTDGDMESVYVKTEDIEWWDAMDFGDLDEALSFVQNAPKEDER